MLTVVDLIFYASDPLDWIPQKANMQRSGPNGRSSYVILCPQMLIISILFRSVLSLSLKSRNLFFIGAFTKSCTLIHRSHLASLLKKLSSSFKQSRRQIIAHLVLKNGTLAPLSLLLSLFLFQKSSISFIT